MKGESGGLGGSLDIEHKRLLYNYGHTYCIGYRYYNKHKHR